MTLAIDPGQALALRGPLNGLQIAVFVPAGAEQMADASLAAVRDLGGAAVLVITGVPHGSLDPQRVRLPSQLFIDLRDDASDDTNDLAFRLKTLFTEIRGASPGISLGVIATDALLAELTRRDLASYVDFFAAPPPRDVPRPVWPRTGAPYAMVWRADSAAREQAAAQPRPWLWRAPADPLEFSTLAQDLARAMPLLVADLVPAGSVRVSCAGRAAATYLNPRTLDTIALASGCGAERVEVQPSAAVAEQVALSNGDLLLRIPVTEGVFADDVRILGVRDLQVREIIARHQATVARQRTLVHSVISTGSMTLTFDVPGFPAPVSISSQTVTYERSGRTEIEQRSIRVNGIEFRDRGVPRLPIIEPERVASPPLAIALSDAYRYRLAGRDRIGPTLCYVVEFDPIDATRTLFRGRAWIAAGSFAMLRVAATQTGLRGPIVSSEQIDEFAPQREGVWLLTRSEVHQIYEGPGHRTPIHRVLTVVRHELNSPEFAARLAAAYRSTNVMLRDTPEGFRYLRRDSHGSSGSEAEPVLAGAAQRVRTLAFGVIVDPNISRPLPFAGLSYVDFNLFGTGAQINAFFGGTYGQLAFSVPSIAGTRWRLAGRAFGIASSYNDRAFDNGREIYERNIRQRPAHASTWVLRPIGPQWSVRAGYELDYTAFGASELTSVAFRVPHDQVAHSIRLALEGQHAGWNGEVWWAPCRRSGWGPWGMAGDDDAPRQRDYQRYGATLTRPFVFTPALVTRIEVAWMSGHDLDRFSRYAFGTFDNRLRGYPSALIRYDRGGVVRAAGAWAVTSRLRVDGFLDSAYVHDPGFGRGLRSYTGVGMGIEAPAPFGLLTALEWGYGVQGVNAGGRRGTHVVRVSAFKIF